MADVTMSIEEYESLMSMIRGDNQGMPDEASSAPMTKKKPRKVSKYSKQFGKELKKLKALHPRTKITALMKRAHRATRRSLKR